MKRRELADDEGRPTPKESGSYQIGSHAGAVLLTRLARAAEDLRKEAVRRKSANPVVRHVLCGAACEIAAARLDELAGDVRDILAELGDDARRPILVAELWEIRREVEPMLASLGPAPGGGTY